MTAFGARRVGGLLVFAIAAAGLLAWLTVAVPVHGMPAHRGGSLARWPVAAAAWLLVLAADAVTVVAILRRPRPLPARGRLLAGEVFRRGRFHIPRLVRIERLRPTLVLTTVLTSVFLAGAALILALPLWVVVLLIATPWIPLYFSEAIWQYDHYGLYSLFGAITLLQLGHLGEHAAQLIQLWATHGNAARSHGIFGQLDVEAVHFAWNVAIWLAACLLLYRFGAHNPWLWIAWVAASVHTPEHLYIYWLYVADHDFYVRGGVAGLLGQGGMLDSPLPRPYLHMAYNLVEVSTFVVAFWDQSKILADRHLGRAWPRLNEVELVALTARSHRLQLAAGEIHHEDSPGFWLVVKGHVERAAGAGALRALRPTELLGVDRDVLEELAVGGQLPVNGAGGPSPASKAGAPERR